MTKFISVLSVLLLVAFAQAGTWKFDKAHTNVKFTVAHMVVTDVVGYFEEFDGTINTPGDDFMGTDVSFTVQTNSINTNNEKRDNHLRSADFFEVEKYPTLEFKTKSFKKINDSKYEITGDLTMHGITKEITLDAKYRGTIKDPRGNTRAGFKATTTIDRYDWDLKYNSTLEAGGLLIGREVEIEINTELIKG